MTFSKTDYIKFKVDIIIFIYCNLNSQLKGNSCFRKFHIKSSCITFYGMFETVKLILNFITVVKPHCIFDSIPDKPLKRKISATFLVQLKICLCN